MKSISAFLAFAFFALLPMGAAAQTVSTASSDMPILNVGNINLSVGPSTLGYTVSADYRLNESFGVRGVLGYSKIETEVIKEGIQVEGSLWGMTFVTDFYALNRKLETEGTIGGAMLLLDYYPGGIWGDEFRVSAGAIKPFYKIDGYGVVNRQEHAPTGDRVWVHDIDTQMSIPNVSPYLGMGYSYHLKDNVYLSLDSGVIFNVEFDGYMRGTALAPSTQEEVDRVFNETIDLKLKELEPYTVLGYVGLTLAYRF